MSLRLPLLHWLGRWCLADAVEDFNPGCSFIAQNRQDLGLRFAVSNRVAKYRAAQEVALLCAIAGLRGEGIASG